MIIFILKYFINVIEWWDYCSCWK